MTLTQRNRNRRLFRSDRKAWTPLVWIPSISLLAVLGALAALPSLPAAAQGSQDATETRTWHAFADRLARSAIMTLRNTDPPMPIDYQVCAEQLGVALLARPDDPFILRAQREALYRANDLDGFNEATRKLALLEPEDTVLQLAVISARITSIQNADDRLAAYNRLLGATRSGIDPSVKSRLALDAAMLAEEQGDTDLFVRMLTMATQLDSTNKEAAARAADFYLARNDDPRGRVELLANVVLADPLDAAAHLNLAREFLRHGATRAGERFLNNTGALWRQEGAGQDEGTLLLRYALQWHHQGGQRVLDELDELESVQRYSILKQREMAEEAGEDPEQIPPYQPQPAMERVRLAIASAIGNDEVTNKAMLNIEKGIRDVILKAQEAMQGENPPAEADVERVVTDLLVESLYLRLWSGQQLDKAQGTIDQLSKISGERSVRPEALERYRGWIAAHRGEYEKAKRLLEPTAEREPFAMLGLGVAAERADDRRGAVRAYARVALDEPGSMMSVWAQERLERMLGQEIAPTPLAVEIEELASSLPTSIDRMTMGTGAFLDFDSEVLSEDLDRLGRVILRLTIRNIGSIPVGVGERSPVRTSALAIPRISASGFRVTDSADPEVVSMNRRLRLMPRESMTVKVWADMGGVGAVLDVESNVQATLRWRTIVGFDIDDNGQYAPGVASLDNESGIASRPRWPELGNNTEDVALSIELAEPGDELLESLMKARSLLLVTSTTNVTDSVEVQEAVCQAIATRFETMTTAERAFTIVMIPPVQTIPAAQLIDDAARAETDPIVTIARIRRLTNPDNEQFAEAMASDDPTVRRLARVLHHRLARAQRLRRGPVDPDAAADAGGGS